MKRQLVFGVVALLSGTLAMAQEGGRGPGGRGGFGNFPNPLFEALDSNSDGVISAEELQNAAAALKKLDRDGDGKLTREEVRPQFGQFGGRPGENPPGGFGRGGEGGPPTFNVESFVARLMERDANKDGKLNAEELGERSARLLETGDKNGDGSLDAEELKAVAESMAARFREGGGGRFGGRPGEGGSRGGEGGNRPQRPQPEGTSNNDRI